MRGVPSSACANASRCRIPFEYRTHRLLRGVGKADPCQQRRGTIAGSAPFSRAKKRIVSRPLRLLYSAMLSGK